MIRQKKYASRDIMKQLQDCLNTLLDENKLTWGCIHKVDFKEEFGLPFGGFTAQKINMGHHVGKHTIMRGLEHFDIEFEIDNGLIVKAMEGEND